MAMVCVPSCPMVTIHPLEYLTHLSQCEKIAPWVREWAQRTVARPDWRKGCGLKYG